MQLVRGQPALQGGCGDKPRTACPPVLESGPRMVQVPAEGTSAHQRAPKPSLCGQPLPRGPRVPEAAPTPRPSAGWPAPGLESCSARVPGGGGTLSVPDKSRDESLATGGGSVRTRGDHKGALGRLHCPETFGKLFKLLEGPGSLQSPCMDHCGLNQRSPTRRGRSGGIPACPHARPLSGL